ncbi:MAG: transketolase [Promethearchaeota archaeon]
MKVQQIEAKETYTVLKNLQDIEIAPSSVVKSVKDKIAEALTKKASDIRKRVVSMITYAQSGHVGGCFSATDLLTVLYYYKMRINPDNPSWEDRYRFILSKGHSAPLLYAILMDLGFLKDHELLTLRMLGSRLQGHPDMRTTPGVDISSGSLGMGLSAGCGMAIAAKLDNKDYKVYVMIGDGELQEGQVWESVMTAVHFHLDNLIAIVDKNNLQTDAPVKSIMNCGNISDQFRAFGWNVIEINGHNIREIMHAYDLADMTRSRPTVIIAETCKGKGVSFMEHNPVYHGTPPKWNEATVAVDEILNGKR